MDDINCRGSAEEGLASTISCVTDKMILNFVDHPLIVRKKRQLFDVQNISLQHSVFDPSSHRHKASMCHEDYHEMGCPLIAVLNVQRDWSLGQAQASATTIL